MIKKITKLLSLAVVMAIATLASLTYAQEENSTTLVTGPTFKSTLSGLAGGLSNIEKIVRVDDLDVRFAQTISLEGANHPVYVVYDSPEKTIQYQTVADIIYMNPESNQMFSEFTNLNEIDLTQFDTSKVTTMQSMFYRCQSLEEINLSKFDTKNVTNMQGMFNGCKNLTNLDISSFDTSSVTNMQTMFYGCSSLETLDLTQFDTSKVTTMQSMFNGCNNLKNLDIRSFDTSSVTNMKLMFNETNRLQILDLGSFDTTNVTSTNKMFYNAGDLEKIYVSDSFVKTSITDDDKMFEGATKLEGGNGTKVSEVGSYDSTYAVIDKEGQPGYFTEKSDKTILVPGADFNIKVKQLATGGTVDKKEAIDTKIKHFREGNLSQRPNIGYVNIATRGSKYSVDAWYDEDEETIYYYTEADEIYLNTDSSWMFYQRNAVEDIDTSKFNTSEVENMQGMFNKTYKLQELDLRGFNTDKATSMQSMFNENKTLKVLDLSSFNTSAVKTMEAMFNSCEGNSCSNLETVYVSSGFSTANLITSSEGVFKGNNKLVGGNGTKFTGEHYDSEYARIDNEGQSGYFTDIYNITVRYFNIDDDKVQYKTGVSKGDKVTKLTPNDFTGRKSGYSLKYYIDSGMSAEFDFNQPITKYTQIYTKWEIEKSSGGNGGRSGGGGRHNDTTSDNNTSSDNNDKNSNKNQDNATDTSGEKSQSTAGNNQSNKSTCAEGDLMCIHSWAYDNQLTKYNNIKNVKFDSLLKRQEMAKISSIFATKFYGKHPDESKKVFCSQYADLNKVNSDMKYYIIQSCELGLMGYKANGTDALENFRPHSPVSLAELSIIISRIMWGNTYALGEKQWYQGHLRATYEADIVDNINNPSRNITRGEAFEMFYRTSSSK